MPEPFIPPSDSQPPPNPDIPVVPPPWTLKAKSWIFLYRDAATAAATGQGKDDDESSSPDDAADLNLNNTPEILQEVLSPGSYHPMEVVHPDALRKLEPSLKPQLHGIGRYFGVMFVIRYSDSDVGPYDELILSPGLFVNPHTGKRNFRITNIYVSTNASVWNGRRNWNIPKHRARFVFEPVGEKGDQRLKLYHPEGSPAPLDSYNPFFTVILRGGSSITRRMPLPKITLISLAHPPLLMPRYPPDNKDTAAVIATDDPENGRENPWLLIHPAFSGSWGVTYTSNLGASDGEKLHEHGDGVSLPRIKILSMGTYFEGTIGFPVPTIAS